jgi:hypothetical protein
MLKEIVVDICSGCFRAVYSLVAVLLNTSSDVEFITFLKLCFIFIMKVIHASYRNFGRCQKRPAKRRVAPYSLYQEAPIYFVMSPPPLFFPGILGFELRALHLLGRCSTT